MNRQLLNLCLAAGLAATAQAAPMACVANATLDEYVALGTGGCILGDKLLSHFERLPVSTVAGDQAAAYGSFAPYTVQSGWNVNRGVGAGSSDTLSFSYLVTALLHPIIGVTGGLVRSVVNGDGANTLVKEICFGGHCAGVADLTLIAFDIGVDQELTVSGYFAPVWSVGVIDTVTIDGGLTGSAFLGGFYNTYHETPEPGTTALLATGAASLIFLRRRR
ncbi:MAG: PEP-CTERM sorting domain-containing protein [Acidobacteria bacterium]|nr:PEP-CTERM sorting domain-containing protein [Acidobacteriota bacterium]